MPTSARPGQSKSTQALWLRALLPLALAFAACESHDLGQQCPMELPAGDDDDGDNRSETPEIVEQNATFPCDSLICMATAGRSPYCTSKCREDISCAAGFECREVQPVGPFAGQKYCAWKACASREDCGTFKKFCCLAVGGSGPNADDKYCAFSNNGDCP